MVSLKKLIAFAFRSTNHLPAWFLCLPGSQEMVGAVLQVTLARYYCYISQRPCGRGTRRKEGDGEGGQEDNRPVLSSGIHPLHQKTLCQTQEKVPNHA